MWLHKLVSLFLMNIIVKGGVRGVYLTRGVEKTCMWMELHPFGYPGHPWDDRHHHAAGCSREEHSRDDVLYPEMKCDVLYPVPGRETQLSDIETQQISSE